MNPKVQQGLITFALATASFVCAQIIYAQLSAKFPKLAAK